MKKFLVCLFILTTVLSLTGCGNDKQPSIEEETVYSEEETVQILTAKFNTEIIENGTETPVYDENLTINNDTYFYNLFEDINYYIKPVKLTEDIEKDVAKSSVIYYSIDSEFEDIALKYVKHLIKANKIDISASEIDEALEQAKKLSDDELEYDGKNGLLIKYYEKDGNKYYEITRVYE